MFCVCSLRHFSELFMLIFVAGFLLANSSCLLMGFTENQCIRMTAACFGMSSLATVFATSFRFVNMKVFPTAICFQIVYNNFTNYLFNFIILMFICFIYLTIY